MREQVEKAARECSSTTRTGGKGRFLDRERGSRLDGAGEEDEAARASCSRGRGAATTETEGGRCGIAGVCSRHLSDANQAQAAHSFIRVTTAARPMVSPKYSTAPPWSSPYRVLTSGAPTRPYWRSDRVYGPGRAIWATGRA